MSIGTLSIIIPVYNVSSYLRECLDSISQINTLDWEAILVDDGSTDDSGAICDEYAQRDKRFKVVHQRNAGVAMARNAGLDIAQGDWIWFVDSDDSINPDFEITNDKAIDESDYILFGLRTFNDGEALYNLPKQKCEVEKATDKNEFLLENVSYHHQRIWYRRRIIEEGNKIRFTKSIRLAEDLEFQYKYLMRCKYPALLPAVLYNYRMREGSATQDGKYRMRAVEDIPIVLENLRQWAKQDDAELAPWLEYRVLKLMQNMLYSASLVKGLDTKSFQKTIDELIDGYKADNWKYVNNNKIRLARYSVRAYFLFNRLYLKIRGLK